MAPTRARAPASRGGTMAPAHRPEGAAGGCHGRASSRSAIAGGALRVALVGAPDVGKSALFNRLTTSYANVSNFPGTSVEVRRGMGRFAQHDVEVLDTPGMYSLLPTTEEERVAQRIVLRGTLDVLVQVADAKSLPRMLPLTLQLADTIYAFRQAGYSYNTAGDQLLEQERTGDRFDSRAQPPSGRGCAAPRAAT